MEIQDRMNGWRARRQEMRVLVRQACGKKASSKHAGAGVDPRLCIV